MVIGSTEQMVPTSILMICRLLALFSRDLACFLGRNSLLLAYRLLHPTLFGQYLQLAPGKARQDELTRIRVNEKSECRTASTLVIGTLPHDKIRDR